MDTRSVVSPPQAHNPFGLEQGCISTFDGLMKKKPALMRGLMTLLRRIFSYDKTHIQVSIYERGEGNAVVHVIRTSNEQHESGTIDENNNVRFLLKETDYRRRVVTFELDIENGEADFSRFIDQIFNGIVRGLGLS